MEPSQSHQGGNGALCLDPEAGETLARPNGLPGQSLDHREAWTCPLPECFFIGNGGVHDHMFGHPKVAFLQEGRCSQPPPPSPAHFTLPKPARIFTVEGFYLHFYQINVCSPPLWLAQGWRVTSGLFPMAPRAGAGGGEVESPPPRNYCQE